MFNPYYNFNELGRVYIEQCDCPERHSILDMSSEGLEDIPLEDQVQFLKTQVNSLWNTLNRCINILNAFQNTSTDFMHHLDDKTMYIADELYHHSNCFHAMLIIGNKEEKKDESNIS